MKIFFFCFFSLVYLQLNGQSGFVFKYQTDMDEIPFDAIEVPDGYIIVSKQGYYPLTYNTLFIKIDFGGDTLSQTIISNPGVTTIFDNLIKISDSTFYCVGTKIYDSTTSINIIKMTSDLDVVYDHEYETGLQYIDSFKGLINHSDELVVYGCGHEQDSAREHPYIYVFAPNGDSIYYQFYRVPRFQLVSSMIEKYDSFGYIMVISGDYQIITNTGGQLLTFNNSYQVTSIDSIPHFLHFYGDLKLYDETHFLMTGNYQKIESKFAIYFYDTSMVYQRSNLFGPIDTINYPGYLYNLDMTDSNHIYMGGTVNQSPYAVFADNKSFLMLCQLDSMLNIKWEKYYGGDMYYNLWCMRSTSDGGNLLLGTTFDYLTQNNERDIYIVKVDSTGFTTGIADKPQEKGLKIFPNPADDHIEMELSDNLGSCTVTIHNIYLKSVKEFKIPDGIFHPIIDVSFLNPGLYIVTVSNDKNLKYIEKIIIN